MIEIYMKIAELQASINNAEANRQALWKADFDAASHEQRMEMIELEKLSVARRQLEAVRSQPRPVTEVRNHYYY